MGKKEQDDLSLKIVHAWKFKDTLFKTKEEAEIAYWADRLRSVFPDRNSLYSYGYSAYEIASKIEMIKAVLSQPPEVNKWPD